MVGVAKKSLDDYLLQLRLGRKYGFDFHKHGESKIGILRSFNKQMKKKCKQGKFMPGRKKKEEEEDYSDMIRNIILDIHAPKINKEIDDSLRIDLVYSKDSTLSVDNKNYNEVDATGIASFEQKSIWNTFNWTGSIYPVNLNMQNLSFNFEEEVPNLWFNEFDHTYSYVWFDHFADSFNA